MKKLLTGLLGAFVFALALPVLAQTPTPSNTPLARTPRYIPFKSAAIGGFKFRIFTIPLDGSYTAGGWLISPANFGLTTISFASFNPTSGAANTGILLLYDYTNSKLKCYKGTATAVAFTECSGTEGSNLTTRALIIGY